MRFAIRFTHKRTTCADSLNPPSPPTQHIHSSCGIAGRCTLSANCDGQKAQNQLAREKFVHQSVYIKRSEEVAKFLQLYNFNLIYFPAVCVATMRIYVYRMSIVLSLQAKVKSYSLRCFVAWRRRSRRCRFGMGLVSYFCQPPEPLRKESEGEYIPAGSSLLLKWVCGGRRWRK